MISIQIVRLHYNYHRKYLIFCKVNDFENQVVLERMIDVRREYKNLI